jgi:hypothetical protein
MFLAAEIEFGLATRLAGQYLWDQAEKKFIDAVQIVPFNAAYIAGQADLLVAKSAARPDEDVFLKKAQKLYEQAERLDPCWAEYSLKSGQVSLALFLKDRQEYGTYLNRAVNDFRRALAKDPNGFNVSFGAGYALMEAWPYADVGARALTIKSLRYALGSKRWYWEQVYPLAWEVTKDFSVLQRLAPPTLQANKDLLYFLESNNLYQFYRQQKRACDYYLMKESPDLFARRQNDQQAAIEAAKKNVVINEVVAPDMWRGVSSDGNVYKNGEMNWTGTMTAVVKGSSEAGKLFIQAKGTPALGIYPYMLIDLDGAPVGEAFVTNVEWKEYVFPLSPRAGPGVLSITFCNDGSDAKNNEDRNLFIGEAKVVADGR